MIDRRKCDDCIFHDGRCTRWDCKYIGREVAEKAYEESQGKRLLIRPCIMMNEKDTKRLHNILLEQMETGLVIIPAYCDVIHKSGDIQIEHTGKWIDDNADKLDSKYGKHLFRCPYCDTYANDFVGGTEDWWDIKEPNFCPNCGEYMRGTGNGRI